MDNNFIMSKLEERGLDKRFRDNPEAIRRICSLIESDLEQNEGKSIEEVLERFDFIRNDGVRSNNAYSINEDGSLSIKLKTDDRRTLDDVSRTDSTLIFSMGENDDLTITESNEIFSRIGENMIGSTNVKFSVFNKNGLEMKRKEVSQDISAKGNASYYGISSYSSFFNGLHRFSLDAVQYGPLREIDLSRGPNLATEYYEVQQSNDTRILAYDRDRIISEHRNGIKPIQVYRQLNGNLYGQVQRGAIPNYAPENNPSRLRGYSEYTADFYANQTDEERETTIQKVYEDLSDKSRPFRETLFERAETDKTLQAIVKRLDLIRTSRVEAQSMRAWGLGDIVKVEDLQRVYEGVNDKELRTVLGRIIETSREANEYKETDAR